MAYLGKPRDEAQYGKLMGMIAPEATPTKRVGTEAPIGAAAGGPSQGKAPADFTKSTASSPGSVFSRQLAGANIGGITKLAEQPLLREAGSESLRVAGEGLGYKAAQSKARSEVPQFQYSAEDDAATGKVVEDILKDQNKQLQAGKVLSQSAPEVPELTIGDIKEFTPNVALRGGSIEGLLKQEAKGPYSTGMAGLDALLFAKKGGAPALAQKGMTLRATEQAAADALEKSATAEERQKMQDLVSGQKSRLFGGLEKAQTSRVADYQKRLAEQTAARDAANERAKQLSLQTAREKAIEDLSRPGLLPGERDAIIAAINQLDVSQQINPMFAGATASLADVATPEEEAQYANLLSLLGVGGKTAEQLKAMGLGKETAGIFTPRKAIQPQEFYEGDRANIDLINALRAAGIRAGSAYRAANPALYTPAIPQEPTVTLPSDRDDLGRPKTTGSRTIESDYEYDPRGRYA